MKWVFLLALIFATPVLAAILRSKRQLIAPTCFVFGLGLFFLGPSLWTSPISWPFWPGYVRGIYVSFIDCVSIALIAATHRTRIPWTVKLAFAVYCSGLVISIFNAHQATMPAIFYAWQLFRTALLFFAIARVTATVKGAAIALIAGLGFALMLESLVVASQFVRGVDRPGGTFNNSNYMGLSLDFVVFPAMALMMGTRRLFWPALTVLAALVIAVLGGSRSTLGLIAGGIPLVIVLSIIHRKSARKYAFAGTAALLLLATAPVFFWAAHRRSEATLDSSDQMRSAMKLAARMIISDYPFGIGANGYVVFANSGGYNDRAGVAWNVENRAAPVHNTYYLVAAEMGLIGLIGLISLMVSFILLGFRMLRRAFPDETGELVPGALATMIVVAAHIAFEWVAMDFLLHSFLAIGAGLLVGLKARSLPRAAGREFAGARALSKIQTA